MSDRGVWVFVVRTYRWG